MKRLKRLQSLMHAFPSGVARAFLGATLPEDKIEEENTEKMRKYKREYRRMKKTLGNVSFIAHPGLKFWLRPGVF